MTLERTTMTMTDAVVQRPERPLTLVEKLEQKESEVSQMMQSDDAPFPYHYMAGKLNAFREIVNIVKQHQSWRKMPSDEKPQDMQVCNLLVKNESEESPTLYDIGLYREYKGEDVWLCMTRPEEHIDPSKILAWQPMNEPSNDFFESLEQPPSEVKE